MACIVRDHLHDVAVSQAVKGTLCEFLGLCQKPWWHAGYVDTAPTAFDCMKHCKDRHAHWQGNCKQVQAL